MNVVTWYGSSPAFEQLGLSARSNSSLKPSAFDLDVYCYTFLFIRGCRQLNPILKRSGLMITRGLKCESPFQTPRSAPYQSTVEYIYDVQLDRDFKVPYSMSNSEEIKLNTTKLNT